MENAGHAQKYKVLESENKLLLSETEQLREVRLFLVLALAVFTIFDRK